MLVAGSAARAEAWVPTQPVEIVVPAGPGGGADQMARFIQTLVTQYKLMPQPLQVVNRAGNSGGEGLQAAQAARGNPHQLVITLSNLFTVPLSTGLVFNWRDLTPVSMLALDQFVLWVPERSPYRSAVDLVAALRVAPARSVRLGGTGSKQEDQLIGTLMDAATGSKLQYVALKGGGDVAKALAAGEIDLSVNNPIEAEALWREGKVRPLCVFDGAPLPYPAKLSNGRSWQELPTCMASGIPAQYLMLRGVFMPAQVTPAQQAYYVALFDKLRQLPEWQAFMVRGAFRQTAMSGAEFVQWLERTEAFHRTLMREARWLAH
ncbi:MAG: hypothetical protein RJA98_3581 [Pseudomonadota bacterium]|jgi:tripartite-type tricarboxylate transporter receptor subunit TctC